MPVCDFCRGTPAVDVTFRNLRHVLVLWHVGVEIAQVCGTCGLALYRRCSEESFRGGWWGPAGFLAPVMLALNRREWSKTRGLGVRGNATMMTDPGGTTVVLDPADNARLDPGEPLHRRPAMYPGPLVWAALLIAVFVRILG